MATIRQKDATRRNIAKAAGVQSVEEGALSERSA